MDEGIGEDKVRGYEDKDAQEEEEELRNYFVPNVELVLLRYNQKLMSSSLAQERLRTYDILLSGSGSVLLLVVAFTITSLLVINGSLSFFLI